VDLDDVIRRAWAQHLEATAACARHLVEHGELLARGTTVAEEDHRRALAAAHRLAGSLGMFGMHAGSELAARLERDLTDARSSHLTGGSFSDVALELARIVEAGPPSRS